MEGALEVQNIIVITIGDFSNDGHSQQQDYYYRCNKTRDGAREAYFAAKDAYPDACPANYCAEYEDHELPSNVAALLRNMGAPMPADLSWVTPDELAALTVWFCRLGDHDLQFEQIEAPSLMFCGPDTKGRYSDSIGYGCFGG